MTDFDPSLYTRPPVLDVPTGYSLGTGLLAAVPSDAARDSRVRADARALRAAVVALRDAWTARATASPPERRPFDVVADASWRALSGALQAITLVTGTPADDARATRAAALHDRLFPQGLAFTQLVYTSQWAHSDRLLAQIDDEALDREIDGLVGPQFLAFVRRAHAAYGQALRLTEPAEAAAVGVREPLRRVQVAIQQYVFSLFSQYPPSDPAHHATLRRALAPIDAFRAAAARTPATPPAPDAPGPVAPPPEPAGPPPTDPIPEVG